VVPGCTWCGRSRGNRACRPRVARGGKGSRPLDVDISRRECNPQHREPPSPREEGGREGGRGRGYPPAAPPWSGCYRGPRRRRPRGLWFFWGEGGGAPCLLSKGWWLWSVSRVELGVYKARRPGPSQSFTGLPAQHHTHQTWRPLWVFHNGVGELDPRTVFNSGFGTVRYPFGFAVAPFVLGSYCREISLLAVEILANDSFSLCWLDLRNTRLFQIHAVLSRYYWDHRVVSRGYLPLFAGTVILETSPNSLNYHSSP